MNSTPLVAVQPKSMFTRKTFWVNVAIAVLAIIGEAEALLPGFADILVLPPAFFRWLALLGAIANVVLRRLSDYPARFRPEDRAIVLERAKSPLDYPPKARPG